MSATPIYLDYAATSPVDPAVRDAMLGCLTGDGVFANPASEHAPGRRAREAVATAREQVAALVGAAAADLVFTSGATEANNLAIKGMFPAHARDGAHFVTTRIEHRSVLDVGRHLERAGVNVTYVDCDRQGRVAPQSVEAAITPATRLVSVMHVNNEIGTVQDVAAIAGVCRRHNVPLHVDAAQSAGKVPLALVAAGIDMCSLTAHKVCGPKGVGALYVRPGLVVEPLLHGGEQERGLRPGTLATHQIAGMGKAFELAADRGEAARIGALRDLLWEGLAAIGGVVRNGDPAATAPHILNVSFAGIDGESLRFAVPEIAVSQGSACTAASPEASHVLSALGLSDARAQSSLRFGVGRFTTAAEIAGAVRRLRVQVLRLRAVAGTAPAWCSA